MYAGKAKSTMETTACALLPSDARIITPYPDESLTAAFNRSATLLDSASTVYVASDSGQCVPFSRYHNQEAIDELNARVIGDLADPSNLENFIAGDLGKVAEYSGECQSNLGVVVSTLGCVSRLTKPHEAMVPSKVTLPCTKDSPLGACVGGALALPSMHRVHGRWVSELDDTSTPAINSLLPGNKSLCMLYMGEDMGGEVTSVPMRTCDKRGDCMAVLRMHQRCAENDTTRDAVRDAIDSCNLPVCHYTVSRAYIDVRDPTLDAEGKPRPAKDVDPKKVAEYTRQVSEIKMLSGMCSTLDDDWCDQMVAPQDLCRTIYDNPALKKQCEDTIDAIEEQHDGIVGKLCPTVAMQSKCSSTSKTGREVCDALKAASQRAVAAGAKADEVARIVNNDMLSCGSMKPVDLCGNLSLDACESAPQCRVDGKTCKSLCPHDLDTCTDTEGCIVAGGVCMKPYDDADDVCRQVAGDSEMLCTTAENSCVHAPGSPCITDTSSWTMGINLPSDQFLKGAAGVTAAVLAAGLALVASRSEEYKQNKAELVKEATDAGRMADAHQKERSAEGNKGNQKSGVSERELVSRTAREQDSTVEARIDDYNEHPENFAREGGVHEKR
jgi:hypothetical protein